MTLNLKQRESMDTLDLQIACLSGCYRVAVSLTDAVFILRAIADPQRFKRSFMP